MGETYHYLATWTGGCCLTVRILAGRQAYMHTNETREREKHVQIYTTYGVLNENSYVGTSNTSDVCTNRHAHPKCRGTQKVERRSPGRALAKHAA